MVRGCWAALALAVLLTGGTAAADSVPARGVLLVAGDTLEDPNFAATVVLLLHYGDEGALGVIVNRPTWVKPSQVLPDVEELADYDGTLYVGGPVAPAGIVALIRLPAGAASKDQLPILDDIYVSIDPEELASLVASADDASRLRLFAGHALWAPGQLEREIAAGGWRVVPGHAQLVFSSTPGTLWQSLHDAPASEEFTASRMPGDLRSSAPGWVADAVRLLR
jgi:putative transcriptional regulator